MSDIRYINITHDGNTNTLAVGSGISASELESVIRSIFNVAGNVVGFQAQNSGLIVPLSLACKNANSLPGTSFSLLTTGSKAKPELLPPAPTNNSISKAAQSNRVSLPAAPPVNPPAPPPREQPSNALTRSNATQNQIQARQLQEKGQENDDAMDELLRFIAALRIKQMLTRTEADALEELLFENSTLIYAAYSVAKSAGDPKYLATVCRDIAQSLMTDMGRAGCAAQDEVLQFCDRLFVMNKITENQLLYMRHMVLIRDDVVATLYDNFQRHRNPERFEMELYRLANTHPRVQSDYENDGDEDDESEKLLASAAVHPDNNENRSAVLTGIVNLMKRAGSITDKESNMLHKLIEAENDYLSAAYELFQQDGDVEELEDTLLRVSRLELARQANEASMRGAATRQETSRIASQDQNPFGRQAQTRPSRPTESSAVNNISADQDIDDDEDEDEEDSNQDESSEDSKEDENQMNAGAKRYVENFLASLGVKNCWDESVPERFIVAVFATAQKGLLSLGQAKALCDLYQAEYDLVRAAWEVFIVQGDVADLMDTLLRIVRGLNFSADGTLMDNNKNQNDDDSEEENSEENSDEESSGENSGEDNNNKQAESTSPPQRQPNAALDSSRREEAIRAVQQAKLDLLRHSLEMMVKQGIAPADKAIGLLKRAMEGDLLVDAAIEAYANDRNVPEFLDTLNILLSHSPEQLEDIMRSALSRQQQGSSVRRDENIGRMQVGPAPMPSTESSGQVPPRFPAPSNVPERDADVSDSDLDSAQMQLREIVCELAEQEILSPEGRNILIKLVLSRDDRLMGAFDVYRESDDLRDLVDSLIRIARIEQSQPTAAASQGSSQMDDSGIELSSLRKQMKDDSDKGFEMTTLNPGDESSLHHHPGQAAGIHPLSRAGSMDSLPSSPATASVSKSPASGGKSKPSPSSTQQPRDDDNDEDNSGSDQEQHANGSQMQLLSKDDQQSILDILNNAGALSNVQFAALTRLLKVGDRRLADIFQRYESDKDVHRLIAQLTDVSKMLVQMVNEEAEEDAAENDDDSDANEDEDWIGDEDEDDGDDELDDEDKESIEMLFLNIVQNMKLNHLETAALRLAIARDDKGIRNSLEQFRKDRSEEKLMSELRKVARDTINATLTEAGYDGLEPDEVTEDNAAADDDKEWINQQDDNDDNEDDEENGESEESESDEEDNEGAPNSSPTQSARDRVFPLLISELSKESILTNEQARKLYKLFMEKNDVLYSALDVYDLDNNISELVDTMLRLSKISN